jgi:hypothetical protein
MPYTGGWLADSSGQPVIDTDVDRLTALETLVDKGNAEPNR